MSLRAPRKCRLLFGRLAASRVHLAAWLQLVLLPFFSVWCWSRCRHSLIFFFFCSSSPCWNNAAASFSPQASYWCCGFGFRCCCRVARACETGIPAIGRLTLSTIKQRLSPTLVLFPDATLSPPPKKKARHRHIYSSGCPHTTQQRKPRPARSCNTPPSSVIPANFQTPACSVSPSSAFSAPFLSDAKPSSRLKSPHFPLA